MQSRILGFFAVLLCCYPAAAQNYQSGTQILYDPQKNVRTTVVNEPLQYNSEQYPSAQGRYLSAPPTTRPPVVTSAVQPSVMPRPQLVQIQPIENVQAVQPISNVQSQQALPTLVQPVYRAPQRPLVVAQVPYVKASEPDQYITQAPASNLVFKANSPPMSLGTLNGIEFGAQGSWYRYQEHVVANKTFMHIDGGSAGLTVDANKVFKDGTFLGASIRGSYGSHDYTGGDQNIFTGETIPATHEGEDDILLEGRLLAGHDFILDKYDYGNFSLSPYAGIGIRFLYNYGSGADSNGVLGYKRYSHYLYVPLGLTQRFRVTDNSRIALNGEYDHLIKGWQESQLGDFQPGAETLSNDQETGFGIKASAMYEQSSWSVGPFFNYWNINQSKRACARYTSTSLLCGTEPHNQTIEYGLQIRYRLGRMW